MPSTKITPSTPKWGLSCDASCKDKRLGMLPNNFLWKGPNLTNSLVKILLRFRLQQIAVTEDIGKCAFLQVKIKEEGRRYLRFYYLRNPEDEDQGTGQLAVYYFNVNIFVSRAFSHPRSRFTAPSTEIQPGTHSTGHWREDTCGQPWEIAGKRDTHVLGLQWTTKEYQLSLEQFKQQSPGIWTKR